MAFVRDCLSGNPLVGPSSQRDQYLEIFFQTNWARLVGFARRRTRGLAMAEDLVSLARQKMLLVETPIVLCDSTLTKYAQQIIANLTKDRSRHVERFGETIELDAISFEPHDRLSPFDQVDDRLEADELWRQVAELPPEAGELILLRYLEDLSIQEITQLTELNEGTVKSRLFRGRELLYQQLHQQYGPADCPTTRPKSSQRQ